MQAQDHIIRKQVQLVVAPSILGLRPSGVEYLADALLAAGLRLCLNTDLAVVRVPDLNDRYSAERDAVTLCLNAGAIREFSEVLGPVVAMSIADGHFPLVLGGDCSILIGIMAALRRRSGYGLVFMDAHADFYAPHQSTTGEVADMDLAIVTGRGPDLLTDIDGGKPYVPDEKVLHIGQRDQEETRRYGSQEIRDTAIRCLDLDFIEANGTAAVISETLKFLEDAPVYGCWLHFDTDVLADDVNPAVDYRLPGGLSLGAAREILSALLATGRIAGMSVTIFNPTKDEGGVIAGRLVEMLGSNEAL
ncbi:MAG TPA: arginase family protein [Chitinophagaceae bacterium]|nr:arginase family protein [Chitinophagaceae bacterium]